jgi:hypothetical protein
MFGTFRDYPKKEVKHFDQIALFYKQQSHGLII